MDFAVFRRVPTHQFRRTRLRSLDSFHGCFPACPYLGISCASVVQLPRCRTSQGRNKGREVLVSTPDHHRCESCWGSPVPWGNPRGSNGVRDCSLLLLPLCSARVVGDNAPHNCPIHGARSSALQMQNCRSPARQHQQHWDPHPLSANPIPHTLYPIP